MNRIMNSVRILLLLIGCLGCLSSWYALLQVAEDLPARVRLQHIDVGFQAASPVVLGRAELVQPVAGPTAERHIAFEKRQNAIFLHDISSRRRVGYFTIAGGYGDTSRIEVPEGASRLIIGQQVWQVLRKGDRLALKPRGSSSRYLIDKTKITLEKNGTIVSSTIPVVRRLSGYMRDYKVQYFIGGQVRAANLATAIAEGTLPDVTLPFKAAKLFYASGRWLIARGLVSVALETRTGRRDVEAEGVRVVDKDGQLLLSKIIVGYTHYALSYARQTDRLTLKPIKRITWLEKADPLAEGQEERVSRTISKPVKPLQPTLLMTYGVSVFVLAVFLWLVHALVGLGQWRGLALAAFGAGLVVSAGYFPILTALAIALLSGLLVPGFFAVFSAQGRRGVRFLPILCPLAALLFFVPGMDGMPPPSRELALAGLWIVFVAPFFGAFITPVAALFWIFFTLVASYGVVSGAHLALLEATGSWVSLFDKHLYALAIIGLVVTLILSLSPGRSWQSLKHFLLPLRPTQSRRSGWRVLRGISWLFKTLWRFGWWIFGIILVGVTFLGNETGFFGFFQPSELSKSVLVVLVASTLTADLARRTLLTAHEGALNFVVPIFALLMAVAILTASFLNYDMSPILVCAVSMLVTLIVGAFLHSKQIMGRKNVRRRQGLPIVVDHQAFRNIPANVYWRSVLRYLKLRSSLWPVVVLSLACIVLALVAYWIIVHPAFQPGANVVHQSWLTTPWKRVQSYYDMALVGGDGLIRLPETGQQLRLAREALVEAHCSLFRELCPLGVGMERLPGATTALLRVPAIQDDFAAVALVYTLGIDGAILYATAQAGLVAIGLAIGIASLFSRFDFRPAAWLAGSATIGLSTLLFAQMGLAWGNVLGFFPVMGQPMTFASFGASHHLGVALPFAAVTMLSALISTPGLTSDASARSELFRYRMTR